VTGRIRESGELLGIRLDDHIIVTGDGFVSAL
jgi:DNA repair protein RadC